MAFPSDYKDLQSDPVYHFHRDTYANTLFDLGTTTTFNGHKMGGGGMVI